jgi:hypothetical protein
MVAGNLLVAVASAAHRQAMAAADTAWAPFAKAHGLNHRAARIDDAHNDEPRVDGTVDGVSVAFKLSTVADVSGVMAVAVPQAPICAHLQIGQEGLFQKIAKVFGAKDLVLGDEPFDSAYLVGTTDDDGARALLTQKTRSEMLALGVVTLTYDDGATNETKPTLALGIAHVVTEAEELDRLLKLLVALATATR